MFLFFIFISSVYLLYLSRTKNTALRLIAFGIFWFFVTLSVESSIIPIPMWINEYRVYLPSIGVFTAIVTGAFLFTERLKNKKTQKVILSFLALMPLVLSPATYKRNTVWGSEISLWEDVARKSPNKARVYNNLGAVYEEKGLIDNAIKHYQSAVRLKPDLIEAHYNLGIVYIDKGDLDKARKELEMALQINPNDHQTRELLNSIK
ncbi:MAG: tetratricopeptide repeat protein [Nitrospirae bacterium]|nr:tetratricopeptide repeat protein [Nitrospirota bacterium]